MEKNFVVFEGLDAAGKSLMAKKLKLFLEKNGFAGRVFLTAEPSQSPFGKELREMLKSESSPKNNAQKFLELYVKDREFHLEHEILPTLNEGKIVLCDRFKYSTVVYQSVQGISVEKILQMHDGMVVPGLVLVLDIDPRLALKRIACSARGARDVFEREAFLQKAREKFLQLPKILPKENIKIIDASMPKKEVFSAVVSEAKNVLF
ncbi:MAG: dTMP kinase [archaeon]